MKIEVELSELERVLVTRHVSISDERNPDGEVRLWCDGLTRHWVAFNDSYAAIVHGDSDPQRYDLGVSWSALMAAEALTNGITSTITIEIDDTGSESTERPAIRLVGPGGTISYPASEFPAPRIGPEGFAMEHTAASGVVDAGDLIRLAAASTMRRRSDDDGDRSGPFALLAFTDGQLRLRSMRSDLDTIDFELNADSGQGDVLVPIDPNALMELLTMFRPTEPLEIRISQLNADPIVISGDGLTGLLKPFPTPLVAMRRRIHDVIAHAVGPLATVVDDDGDFQLRRHSTPIYGRTHTDGNGAIWLQVFAVLLSDVDPTPELYRELNDLNSTATYARLFHVDASVLAEVDLLAATLDAAELTTAIDRISDIAERVAPLVATVMGGTLLNDAQASRWQHYRSTIITAELHPTTMTALNGPDAIEPWPFEDPVHVITTWNPQGVLRPYDTNEENNRRLAHDLIELDATFVHAIGNATETGHHEDSLLVWGIDRTMARQLGRRGSQDAIFELTAEEVRLISCVDDRTETWPRQSAHQPETPERSHDG